MSPLHLRQLGRTDLYLSQLGFGSASLGNLYQSLDDQQALETVHSALQLGVRYFDTAPHYGFGLAEKRLGKALQHQPEKIIISSKVGRVLQPISGRDLSAPRQGFISPEPLESTFDYSYDAVQRSLADSLERLGQRLDIVLVHDLGSYTHGDAHEQRLREFFHSDTGGYRALREWRDAGMLKAIGLGVNEWQICVQALQQGEFDCFLLAGRYTLLEQSPLTHLLPLCVERGIGLIIGGAFNSGILATGVRNDGPHYYDYCPAPAHIIERVRQIETICDAHGVTLAAAALQFPLAHPQVCSVIPGSSSPEQVQQNAALLEQPIPSAFWAELRHQSLLHESAPIPAGADLN